MLKLGHRFAVSTLYNWLSFGTGQSGRITATTAVLDARPWRSSRAPGRPRWSST
ncbi:MAG TPA: hypothetical protein VH988_26705 [Thermoanaerobaculia bacterium]|nr:hypothetical protein [Thermoanaerobaculia bacterium]